MTCRATAPRWLVRRERRPHAATNLYCFPHAGGTPGEYVRWSDGLPDVQVWAIQLPGRATRLAEPPFTRMPALVDALLESVAFDPPFTLFGHSLGALVAFEVARALRDRGRERPEHLFASSCRPPPFPPPRTPLHTLSDDRLLAEVERRWGSLPAAVRSDPELYGLALGCYRADFAILETYRHVPGEPLDLPLTALAGDGERHRSRADGWRAHTRGPVTTRFLSGDHFYFREHRAELLGLLRETINGGHAS